MKTSFKTLILEEISIKGDNLQISVQHYRSASTKDSISTYFRLQPYTTSIKGVNAEIYSMLNYVSSETTTEILKSLKGNGPYGVNEKQFEAFMKDVSINVKKIVGRIKPDVIIYPKSKSDFLKKFVGVIKTAAPSAEVVDEGFVKAQLDAENIEPLINTKHPDWEKFESLTGLTVFKHTVAPK